MKIYSINPICFTAKKQNKKFFNSQLEDRKANRDAFYKHIEKYLNEEYDKIKYLKEFKNEVNKIRQNGEGQFFTNIEKKYIKDLLMTLDFTDKLEKFPEEYLKENMQKLLANKK